MNSTSSWDHVTVQLWKYLFVCVIYSSDVVTHEGVCAAASDTQLLLRFAAKKAEQNLWLLIDKPE